MLLHQYGKLKSLRQKYPEEYKAMCRDGTSKKEMLETLLLLEVDQAIIEKINDVSMVLGDEQAIQMIVSTIAKSYGQLLNLYGIKFGEACKLREMFNKLVKGYENNE